MDEHRDLADFEGFVLPMGNIEDAPDGNWLLRELAAESGGRLVEIRPGCFLESKLGGSPITPVTVIS